MTETPDEINARPGGPFYRCRRCRVASGLDWYRGTSCPVCRDPACIAFCDREWEQAYYADDDEEW